MNKLTVRVVEPNLSQSSHMAIKATAFWSDHGRGFLADELLPELGPDEVLVDTLYSAISKGTETLVFNGQVPVSEHHTMRAPFQAGEFAGQVKYGYCNVGQVSQGPKDWVGERVFCLYPHQTCYVVPIDRIHRLPEDLPAQRAVLAANMETAVNGIADAGLDSEINGGAIHSVSVIGAGVVGCLMAHQARRHGHQVELIDINPERKKMADGLGVAFKTPEHASSHRSVVIHTSATEQGLTQALSLADQEGLVLEMSWFGTTQPKLPLGEGFHVKRLTLRSSQVGHIAPNRQASWTYQSRFSYALDALKDPSLDQLITHIAPFEQMPQVMHDLAQGKTDALCQVMDYGHLTHE